jgi:outer membrane protein OmpA-like peptidoglycan-associated protein
MSIRALTIGVTALVLAVPAGAQQRGTMEFGAFGSVASFDNALGLKSAYGGGGRIGMFLNPRWSIEFEDAEMRATRPGGLNDVNVGLLSGRLVAVPIKAGGLSVLLGGGAGVSTETNFLHSYGLDVLGGVKIAMGDNAALRVDGVLDWLANEDWKMYKSLRVGISLYRHPSQEVRTVTVTAPAAAQPMPQMMTHEDSVSAAETRRLRAADAALRALRDSLRNAPAGGMTAAEMTAMEARIHFAFDKSALTDSAKAILDDKVRVFRANPEMTIAIVGHTDIAGTDAYNQALGMRRAEAAKAYIVSKGINANRIVIESRGENQPVTQAAGRAGQAPNRRAVFRIVIAPDVKQP